MSQRLVFWVYGSDNSHDQSGKFVYFYNNFPNKKTSIFKAALADFLTTWGQHVKYYHLFKVECVSNQLVIYIIQCSKPRETLSFFRSCTCVDECLLSFSLV